MTPELMFELLVMMTIVLFGLGVFTTLIGIYILARRTLGHEVRTIATQTARLAQKGIAEDIAGLVGNASALLEALNSLVRTSAGVGVFLTIFGMVLIITASWLALQIL